MPKKAVKSKTKKVALPDSRISKIFSEVAHRVSPSKEEAKREKAFAEKLRKALSKELKKEAKVHFVGSTARDTGIRGDKDIDIFLAFNREKKRGYIVSKTSQVARKLFKTNWETHYAEHPYLQGVLEGYKVEIIPCFSIEQNEGIISAVDRTPLHAGYLQKHLKENQKRDVRLMKQLLKSHRIYGAEAKIEGFSGLVCEYLILNYGNLTNLMKFASEWMIPVVIDVAGQRSDDIDALPKIFSSPLILIDAIDQSRNAAAAVSATSVSKFIALSRAFLAKPSIDFFFPSETRATSRELQIALNKRMHVLVLKMQRPDGIVEDIFVPQLRKSELSLIDKLNREGFRVFSSESFETSKECFIILEFENIFAPKLKRISGPPVSLYKETKNFILAHQGEKLVRGPFIDGEKIAVEKERQILDARKFLELMKKDPQKYGIASHFIKPFSQLSILEGEGILRENERDVEFGKGFSRFIFKKDSFL